MDKEKIISDLYIEIQVAKNTLEHNKHFSKDEELISYNEEKLELLQGVRDLIENQKKAMNKLISYIAVQENKDFEQVRKEFGIV